MTGTVYKSTGSWYLVKAEKGGFYECRIKGKFRIKGIKSTNPVAVGDRVVFGLEDDMKHGIIEKILDRENYIVRKSVNLSKQNHIIASNIDLVFLLATPVSPVTHSIFIDRFLVTAEAYKIPVVLLFNKIDKFDAAEMDKVEALSGLYTKIGYPCISISAKHGENTGKVKALMRNKTSMFAGHSGVGKSTLVNQIEPSLDLKIAEISEQHGQGQHTTTFAEMHDLALSTGSGQAFGARIIDTPGIKGFGIVDMEKEEIGNYFPEFFALKPLCKFNNCLHLDEPKCAVKEALETGEIAESRYRSYLQMMGEDEGESYR